MPLAATNSSGLRMDDPHRTSRRRPRSRTRSRCSFQSSKFTRPFWATGRSASTVDLMMASQFGRTALLTDDLIIVMQLRDGSALVVERRSGVSAKRRPLRNSAGYRVPEPSHHRSHGLGEPEPTQGHFRGWRRHHRTSSTPSTHLLRWNRCPKPDRNRFATSQLP